MAIFPVILPVAGAGEIISGRKGISLIRSRSREALRLSAEKSGVMFGELSKDERGAPQPFRGNFWSVSHKPKQVAAVVSKKRIGIDIEEIKPRSPFLFRYVAGETEWSFCPEKSWDTFFRYWTAKEAVLKAVGIGIRELKICRIISIPDSKHIILNYRNLDWIVAQLVYKGHLISVVKNDHEVHWVIPDTST